MSTGARFTRLPAGAVMIQLSGEFDLATKATLQAYLQGAIHLSGDLVLDMSAVEFFDCGALGVLVWARNQVVPTGRSLTLVAPTPSLCRLIDLAGLRDTLHARADLPSALSA